MCIRDRSITETVLDLSGDGSVAEVTSNGGAVTVSQGTSLALNGGDVYKRQVLVNQVVFTLSRMREGTPVSTLFCGLG